jgi:DNA-binding NarL/FixJ family response regulator
METPRPLRLMLLDDHDAAREALARRLRVEPRLELVAHTASVPESCALLDGAAIDVALVDPRRDDGAGIDAIAALSGRPVQARPLIAVYVTYFKPSEWALAQGAGAGAWVLKQPDIDALVTQLLTAVGQARSAA